MAIVDKLAVINALVDNETNINYYVISLFYKQFVRKEAKKVERPVGRSWLYWNLANIISSTRYFSPVIFFIVPLIVPLSFEIIIICYVILAITDALDGWIANRIGNYGGIGKIIDMSADKVLHISFFLYLLSNSRLDTPITLIAVAIIVQEIRIALLVIEAVNLVAEKELREKLFLSKKRRYYLAYNSVKQGIIKEVTANEPGRYKMVAYSMGVYFFLASLIKPNKILYWESVVILLVGLYLSFIARRKYKYDFEIWKQRFLAELKR